MLLRSSFTDDAFGKVTSAPSFPLPYWATRGEKRLGGGWQGFMQRQMKLRATPRNNESDIQHGRKMEDALTNFVQHEDQAFSFCLPPTYLLFHQPTSAAFWVPCVENKHDNVRLVDDFVKRADVVPAQLLLRFRGAVRG